MAPRTMSFATVLWLLALHSGSVVAEELLSVASGATRVNLVELYTSEGCNSCPPADRWLSALRDSAELWSAVVPVAFHVTYWDHLGWSDRFADPEFDRRQRRVARAAGAQVYTPGVFVNGREWRRWYGTEFDPEGFEASEPGVLRAELRERRAHVAFAALVLLRAPSVHLVWLRSGQQSSVTRGENRGRTLRHEFVAGHVQRAALSKAAHGWHATLDFQPEHAEQADAFAVWVADADGWPLQATGRWLP